MREFWRFAVPISTLLVLAINVLAATGRINGTTPGQISDALPTPITPAGYAFSIWSLIYIGLLIFSIKQWGLNTPVLDSVRPLYVLNALGNIAWIFVWHYGWIVFSILPMLVILSTLLRINQLVAHNAPLWSVKVPFNIYFGWIYVASVVNAATILSFFKRNPPEIWAALVLLVLALLAVGTRFKIGAPAFSLTVSWAFFAITISRGLDSIVGIVALLGAVICVVCSLLPLSILPRANKVSIEKT